MTSLYQVEQDTDTPLARWRFEETSGTTFAEDVAAVTATLSGAVTPGSRSGPYPGPGVGADFNGGYATVSGVSAWRPQTVDALVTFDTVPSTSSTLRPALFMHDGTGAAQLPLVLAFNIDATHQGQLGFGYFLTSGGYRAVNMTTAITTGVVHHIVGVYDGATTLTLYVDGVSVATGTVTARGTLTGILGTGHIGRRFDNTAQIDGRLWDLALYNGALSSTRVAAHYTASQQLAGLAMTDGGTLSGWGGTAVATGSWAGPISGGGNLRWTSPTVGIGAPARIRFTPHPGDYV